MSGPESPQRELKSEDLLRMLHTMLMIRRFEERVIKELETGHVKGFVHSYIGEEAVAVGVCSALTNNDYVTSTHRGHGHCIAKGVSVKRMMAELFGKRTGACKGKGGSMHIADVSLGVLGTNGIVGGGIPIATGAALSAKYRGSGQVSVAFLGEGAINQGSVHESLNLASVLTLPIVFVCENNKYAEATPATDLTSVKDLTIRASAYAIPAFQVDGMDVLAVYRAASDAVAKARGGGGPSLLLCDTYRFRGHYEGDSQVYRTQDEVDRWREKDPVLQAKREMKHRGIITEEKFDAMAKSVSVELDEAVEFAEASEWPAPGEVLDDVFSETR